jgi:hypothetical protein
MYDYSYLEARIVPIWEQHVAIYAHCLACGKRFSTTASTKTLGVSNIRLKFRNHKRPDRQPCIAGVPSVNAKYKKYRDKRIAKNG